ncbi:peroxiredoxin family protein [Actinokineospora guangxiensis]|uniref:Peroxiredoxin family protein n=1 Tax=Actinokineospora guangxiensis TaxID=1490288 RepID=A0ABW0EUX9_9PSEU
MADVELFCRVLLAAVFTASALGKARDPRGFARYLGLIGFPIRVRSVAVVAVVVGELVTAAGLAVGVRVAYLSAAVLTVLFSGGLVVAMRGRATVCHCFGPGREPVSGRHLARNAVLVVAAIAGWSLAGFPGDPAHPVIAVAAGLAACGLAVVLPELGAAGTVLPRGRRAPSFTAATLDGGTFAIDDHRRTAVVLVFLSPGCASCDRQLPRVLQVRQVLANSGVLVLPVFFDDAHDSRAEISAYAAANDVPDQSLVADADSPLAGTYNPKRRTPFYYVIDSGSISGSGVVGGADWSADLRALLAERPTRPLTH